MSILQHKIIHCIFCNKEQKDHTKKLWEMHKSVVEKTLKTTRHKKLWTMHIGLGPAYKAILPNDFQYDKGLKLVEWLEPIYMSCSGCSHYLGRLEEDHADVLDGMCIECFRQLTGQEEVQLTEIGSISNEEFGRRMAWNNPGIDACFDLDNPKTWSDSFKEWHVEFVRKSCHVEKHCKDCKYCKKKWYA